MTMISALLIVVCIALVLGIILAPIIEEKLWNHDPNRKKGDDDE